MTTSIVPWRVHGFARRGIRGFRVQNDRTIVGRTRPFFLTGKSAHPIVHPSAVAEEEPRADSERE
jgi:hypothetical protein